MSIPFENGVEQTYVIEGGDAELTDVTVSEITFPDATTLTTAPTGPSTGTMTIVWYTNDDGSGGYRIVPGAQYQKLGDYYTVVLPATPSSGESGFTGALSVVLSNNEFRNKTVSPSTSGVLNTGTGLYTQPNVNGYACFGIRSATNPPTGTFTFKMS